MGHPRSRFCFIFGLFQTNITFLQQIEDKNVHPVFCTGIRTPKTLDHESSPITTRPVLVPNNVKCFLAHIGPIKFLTFDATLLFWIELSCLGKDYWKSTKSNLATDWVLFFDRRGQKIWRSSRSRSLVDVSEPASGTKLYTK